MIKIQVLLQMVYLNMKTGKCNHNLTWNDFISALMGVAELAKGIQYEDPIKTGYLLFLSASITSHFFLLKDYFHFILKTLKPQKIANNIIIVILSMILPIKHNDKYMLLTQIITCTTIKSHILGLAEVLVILCLRFKLLLCYYYAHTLFFFFHPSVG